MQGCRGVRALRVILSKLKRSIQPPAAALIAVHVEWDNTISTDDSLRAVKS
jgi:hypothetical protein